MKKTIVVTLVLVMAFVLGACGSAQPTAAPATVAPATAKPATAAPATVAPATVAPTLAPKTYKVGISMFVMDAGMTALTGLLKQDLANADIPTEVFVTSADSSMDKQVSDVEDLVTKGCDIIFIMGFDQKAIVGALTYAKQHNVMVGLGGPANSTDYTYVYQAFSEQTTGIMQADWLYKNYLSVNPNTQYKIALSNGTMSTSGGKGRHDGVVNELKASGATNYTIVADQDNNYVTETAQAWAEDLMTSHPEVNVIIAANDDMALGIANAIEGVGRTGKIVVLGTDGMDVGLNLIKNGKMNMTVKLNVQGIAQGMVDAIVGALKGTLKLDANKTAMGDPSKTFQNVDKTNIQDFLK